MKTLKTPLTALAFVVASATVLGAQDPQEITVGARVGSQPPSGYDDGSRRDPFVSLIAAKRAAGVPSGHPVAGLAGLSVSDAVVTGIVKSGSKVLAILQGPDGKSFMAHSQDRLLDGVVKSIDTEGVVFVATVSDAAGVSRPREIRKTIHVMAGGGQ
jgi:hypothetical protein